jgi:tetratricopeptide (TPR) repeat protein
MDILIDVNAALSLVAALMAIAATLLHASRKEKKAGNGMAALRHLKECYRIAIEIRNATKGLAEQGGELGRACEQYSQQLRAFETAAGFEASINAMDDAISTAHRIAGILSRDGRAEDAAEVNELAASASHQALMWWREARPKEGAEAASQPTVGVRAGIGATAVCWIGLSWLEAWKAGVLLMFVVMIYSAAEAVLFCRRETRGG